MRLARELVADAHMALATDGRHRGIAWCDCPIAEIYRDLKQCSLCGLKDSVWLQLDPLKLETMNIRSWLVACDDCLNELADEI